MVLGFSTWDGVLTDSGRLFITQREWPCPHCGEPVRALAAGALCAQCSPRPQPYAHGLCERQRAKLGHAQS